ncbi:hypothetical protein A5753_14055 [Mycobacterium sp. 852002-51971_SCH5477799-a]|nr:hypothetical protein A5753_14055 [Mycobacterium sp. 852002-51971_SCH5477799-a]
MATELDCHPKAAVLGAFESDASHAKGERRVAAGGLLCPPTLSTHGYEVIRRDTIPEMRAVLVAFLLC